MYQLVFKNLSKANERRTEKKKEEELLPYVQLFEMCVIEIIQKSCECMENL